MVDRSRWWWRLAFYSALLPLILPLAVLFIAHRLWIRRKGLVGLREKVTGIGQRIAPGQVLVHGVSLGEVNLMRPLVPRLEAALGCQCVLTTTTETGRARLDELFPRHDRAFLPLDLPWAMLRFLSRSKPRAVILLELEVWPILLLVCHLRGIPVMLLNARVSARSYRGYVRARWLLRPLFRNMTLALGQNGTWTARLIGLGVRRERAVVSGSMKADMVMPATPTQAQALADRVGLLAHQPVLLLASTSTGAKQEEQVLLAEGISAWQTRGWQVVICPRHPERGEEIATWIKSVGGQARRSSRGERRSDDNDIIVIDEIGCLGALYAWTAAVNGIAAVGGSFGSGRGGQNMLEACAVGCCTVVGWDTRNFPDAMALLRDADGVIEVAVDTVTRQLRQLADDTARRRELGQRGRLAWSVGRGAVERSVTLVRRCLQA